MVCEGEKTEVHYFSDFKQELRGGLIAIEVSGGEGDPLQIVQDAIQRRDQAAKEARRNGDVNLRFDSVWCIFDVDEHERLSEALSLALKKHIQVALSNPCFELWALIHFQRQSGYIERDDVKTALRRYIAEYDKILDCDRMRPHRGIATERAIELSEMHERDGKSPQANPSTGVHRLVADLVKFAGSPGII